MDGRPEYCKDVYKGRCLGIECSACHPDGANQDLIKKLGGNVDLVKNLKKDYVVLSKDYIRLLIEDAEYGKDIYGYDSREFTFYQGRIDFLTKLLKGGSDE